MDNANVNVAVLESNNNMTLIPRSLTLSVSSSNNSIDLQVFDLDDALAVVDEESSRRLVEAWETFVSKLPTVNDVRSDDVCSVCMEGFGHGDTDGENKRVPCGHVYHSNCITVWLEHCNCCPLCRRHISLF